jgi:DNA (cytosine-5)-methyltransferase 1
MIYGSVCSGIEAASAAWHPLGWRASFLSEIAGFPRALLAHHYPGVPLRGDFTEVQAGEHEPIDVLAGGTPCQSFSVAGLRGGLSDARATRRSATAWPFRVWPISDVGSPRLILLLRHKENYYPG